jgi:GNAT superfamily N-acetyltransferase
VQVRLEPTPHPDDLATIERGLVEHAAGTGVEPRNHQPLFVIGRDEAGRIVGGLVGNTVWGWLQVKQLWVVETERRRGHGRRLLEAAEVEAKRRGCHHALLDTFDFQAPRFYERLGYRTFGSLPDFPRGHVRSFFSKALG